jgi:enoyl-[acyl-carrier protein] reductase/trans-2-enoyl-CoA reductase (NAD+)
MTLKQPRGAPVTARVIRPTARGFLHLDSHPDGCARTVEDMWAGVAPADPVKAAAPVTLVVGCSAGYGLAATVAGIARYGARGVGVCFEKPPSARRTATAGWYRVITADRLARAAGAEFAFVNGDAFADDTKDDVLDLIAGRFGRLDRLIYSIAAPRRTDPDTATTYASVIKPIGAAHRTKTLVFDSDGRAECREVEVAEASDAEVADTVAVMGGVDWVRWIDALAARDLLAPGFATVALTYIGSDLTAPIYRYGTIGAAKQDLERTARDLDARLRGAGPGGDAGTGADGMGAAGGGWAATSVNGAAVTQSSTAIPGIALYIGLLRRVLGAAMRSPIEQSVDLWDHLAGVGARDRDDLDRIRLDGWELNPDVQSEITARWAAAADDTIAELADLDWFRDEVRRLYGFAVPGVDYDGPTEPDQDWPASTVDAKGSGQ